MDLPNKKYSVIYADPPWNYLQKGAAGKKQGYAAQHYKTMTTDDICALPVQQLAGGGWMPIIHVGNISHTPGCTSSYGCLGVYLQNRCFCLGEKIQMRKKLRWDGCVHPRKRRNLSVGCVA